jgi:DNA-binding LytR/AlgR family response regulator
MEIRCIAIDDEPLSIEKLSSFISKISWLKLQRTFNNAIDALIFLKENETDLIFLDIQMDEFSGIDFLRSLKVKPKVIITSAYKEYAIAGYEFEVCDYLLKPFGFERFVTATEKIFNQFNTISSVKRSYIFVKSGYSMERVDFDSILYIEGMQEYLQIVTKSSKLMVLQSFAGIELLLPSENFVRVHKSFIVAIDKIDKIERSTIKINDKTIPVGSNYKENFIKLVLQT